MSEFVHAETNKTSIYYSNNMNSVKAAIQYFKKQGNSEPTIADIAFRTGLAISKVEKAMELLTMTDMMSYESEVTDGVLMQKSESPEDHAIKSERNEIVIAALRKLTPLDREVITIRYGLGDEEPVESLSKISRMMHIPVNKVSGSIQRAINILRHNPQLRALAAPDLAKHEKRAQGPELVPIDDSDLIRAAYDSLDDDYFDDMCDDEDDTDEIIELVL